MFKLSRLRFTTAATVLAALSLLPAAQAGVVFSPSSIVISADGTYITDTVNHRDWYRFSNAQTTVGMSLSEVSTLFYGTGWSLASLSQVQALQGQFGWTGDTTSGNTNINFGLTTAMGNYLGFTSEYFVQHDDGVNETGQAIQAITGDVWNGLFNSTMSLTSQLPDVGFAAGDYVNGMFKFQDSDVAVRGIGTWLSRAHPADDGGGGGGGGGGGVGVDCSPLVPCAATNLPEPASQGLVLMALIAVGAAKRHHRRRNQLV